MTPLRLLVTGRDGQIARSLLECAGTALDVQAIGRPALDLARPDGVAAALAAVSCDIIVHAAAFTAVDQAEDEPELAMRINAAGAGAVAAFAAARGLPLIHLSTDYVFDGGGTRPWQEGDPVSPLGAYGRSKLAGEEAVLAAHPGAVILRLAWVHSPFGRNFVRTMLRLAAARDTIRVVADQRGSPSYAPALAAAIAAIARRRVAEPELPELAGLFHLAGAGAASWAEVATATFAASARLGGPVAAVEPITTAEYPTRARRPAHSVLDCSRIDRIYGVTLPPWQAGVEACVARILAAPGEET